MPVSKMCAEEAGCSSSVDALLSNTTSGAGGMAGSPCWVCLRAAASPRAQPRGSVNPPLGCRMCSPVLQLALQQYFFLPCRAGVTAQKQGRRVQALLLSKFLALHKQIKRAMLGPGQ